MNAFHKATCWIISFGLIFIGAPPTWVFAQAPGTERASEPQDVFEKIELYMESIRELRRHLDRSQIESEVLLETLEYDQDQIVRYVTDEIEFEQYTGALRGAEGTIRSAAGNALDQSILLAKLLKDAGFEARIVRGMISPRLAEVLLAGMGASRNEASPYANEEAFKSVLRRMWIQSGQSEQEFESFAKHLDNSAVPTNSELIRITQEESEFILDHLQSKNITLGDAGGYANLVEEARDYFWVEYELDKAGGWVPVHPAAGQSDLDLNAIRPEQFFADSIPTELQHRFRFEVYLETVSGDKRNTRLLLPPWERPTANLIDRPLSFTITPLSYVNQLDQDKLDFSASGNDVFIPLFQGEYAGQTFDLLGNIVPLDAALSNYAALFATVAEKLSNSAASLAAVGEDNSDAAGPIVSLGALKFRFVFIEPSGVETEYWRTVMLDSTSGDEGESEARLQLYSRLTTMYSFQLSMGGSNTAAAMDASLRMIEAKQPVLVKSVARLLGTEVPETSNQSQTDFAWVGLPATYEIFDSYDEVAKTQTYRHVPSLLIHKSALPTTRGDALESTDIVQNKRRLRSARLNATLSGLKSMVSVGVWESVTEDSLLMGAPEAKIDTNTMFERYRQSGRQFEVLTAEDVDRLTGFDIPEQTKTVLGRELKLGYVVVLPKPGDLPDTENLHWWRINAKTGETLGISATGAGAGEAVKYTLFQRLVAGGVIGSLVGITCDMARKNALRDTSLSASDCITLGVTTGIGAAMGGSVFEGVPTGILIGVAAMVFQKLIAPYTDK